MNSNDLVNAMHGTLKMYWRMRAGVALVRQSDNDEYLGIKINFLIPSLPSNPFVMLPEPSEVLFEEIFKYIDLGHLSHDVFFRIIAHLETFYSSKLSARGLSSHGTLGALQKNCENAYGIPVAAAGYIDEIRERRNSLIHNHGVPNQKYLTAAMAVYAQSGGIIGDPRGVTILKLSDAYILHCVSSIAVYSSLF